MTNEAATIALAHFKSDGTGTFADEKITWKVTKEDKESLTVELYSNSHLL
jgi:hypothetical protein